MTRPEKHSLTLKGHRTSVSLEPEFWAAFRAIAAAEHKPINALAAEIDEARGTDIGLASAIRPLHPTVLSKRACTALKLFLVAKAEILTNLSADHATDMC